MPDLTQYLLYGLLALVFTIAVLWLYNRREARRKHAMDLAALMNQWGLVWFAGLYEDYAVGDYSGLAHRVREIVKAVRSDQAMVEQLWDAAKKVAVYAAENDKTKADELRKILGVVSVVSAGNTGAKTTSV